MYDLYQQFFCIHSKRFSKKLELLSSRCGKEVTELLSNITTCYCIAITEINLHSSWRSKKLVYVVEQQCSNRKCEFIGYL